MTHPEYLRKWADDIESARPSGGGPSLVKALRDAADQLVQRTVWAGHSRKTDAEVVAALTDARVEERVGPRSLEERLGGLLSDTKIHKLRMEFDELDDELHHARMSDEGCPNHPPDVGADVPGGGATE